MTDFHTALSNDSPFVWVAHRGDGVSHSSAFIENTLPSFHEAIRLGADALEFDIQMTQDDELVIFHDDLIGPEHSSDMTQAVFINTLTLNQVQALRLGSSNTVIPTVRDLFKAFRNCTLFYCELKHHPRLGTNYHENMCRALLALIQEFDIASSCMVVSFNPELLGFCASEAPSLLYGLNLNSDSPQFDLSTLPIACLCPEFSAVDALVPNSWQGSVLPYNVNQVGDIQKCIANGFSGATTDQLALKGMIEGDANP